MWGEQRKKAQGRETTSKEPTLTHTQDAIVLAFGGAAWNGADILTRQCPCGAQATQFSAVGLPLRFRLMGPRRRAAQIWGSIFFFGSVRSGGASEKLRIHPKNFAPDKSVRHAGPPDKEVKQKNTEKKK